MSNSKSGNKMQVKPSTVHNKYQSFLLVSLLVAALALVVVVFLNSARSADAQSTQGSRAANPAATAAPTVAMTGAMDMAGMVMTGTTDMTSVFPMTNTDVVTASLTHNHAGMGSGAMVTATVAPAAAPTATAITVARATPTSALTETSPSTTALTSTVVPTPGSPAGIGIAAPIPGASSAEVEALMQDVLLLVRSHNSRMQKLLAGSPTTEELAEMNADMLVLTDMMRRLIGLAQGQVSAVVSPAAAVPSANLAMPGMATTSAVTATNTMSGMDMSGISATPMAPMAPMAPTGVLTDTMSSQSMDPSMAALHEKLQTIATLMQDARQQLDAMAANGASDAEMQDLRAKLEQLRYMLREAMVEMQSAAAPAPATLDSPIAGAASAAAASGGMGGMMDSMSGMMDSMSSMMDSMMGGMGGSSSSMPAMPATGTSGAAPSQGAASSGPDAAALVRSAEAGGVTLTVLPLNLAATSDGTLNFHVKIDTHTAALDQDLAPLSVLRASTGAQVASIKWDGPTGGHHVEGTLSFPRFDQNGAAIATPGVGTLTLSIRDYAGVAQRSFVWDLSQ